MLKFAEKINKASVSYELACNTAKTADIYNHAVLKANRLNLPFVYHLRSLEAEVIMKTVKNAFSVVKQNGAFKINVFSGKDMDTVRIESSHDLTTVLKQLDLVKFIDKTFKASNGKTYYRYELIFELTY